jgi:hypothetical protein
MLALHEAVMGQGAPAAVMCCEQEAGNDDAAPPAGSWLVDRSSGAVFTGESTIAHLLRLPAGDSAQRVRYRVLVPQLGTYVPPVGAWYLFQ